MDPTEANDTGDVEVPLKTLLRWSEALSGIARTGLAFTESLYERERFEEILKVAADIRAETDGTDAGPDHAGGLVQEWMRGGGQGGAGLRHAQGGRGCRGGQRQGARSS